MADLSVNLAGIQSPNPFWVASGPPSNTAYQCHRAFEAGWGGVVWKTIGDPIVNVSSRGAFRGEPRSPAYGASKAGLNALGQSLAQALAPHHISVATVAPGFVETDMAAAFLEGPNGDAIRAQSPWGRVARPEEVAAAVLYLASPEAEFVSGAILDLNGASYLRT